MGERGISPKKTYPLTSISFLPLTRAETRSLAHWWDMKCPEGQEVLARWHLQKEPVSGSWQQVLGTWQYRTLQRIWPPPRTVIGMVEQSVPGSKCLLELGQSPGRLGVGGHWEQRLGRQEEWALPCRSYLFSCSLRVWMLRLKKKKKTIQEHHSTDPGGLHNSLTPTCLFCKRKSRLLLNFGLYIQNLNLTSCSVLVFFPPAVCVGEVPGFYLIGKIVTE